MLDRSAVHRLSLLEGLPIEEIDALIEIAQIIEYPAGTMLFYEGDRSEHFSIILEGEVEIIKSLGKPEESNIAIVRSGDILGEMGLFLSSQLRMKSARARTHTVCLALSRNDFLTLLQRQPEVAIRVLQEMSQRIFHNEALTVESLREKNRQLTQAYQELQAAQARLIEQEKLEHELMLARRIQEDLFPKTMPELNGWRLDAYWRPARQVGGDFYDFVLQPERCLRFWIADVSGKGVPAALVMAQTHSILRALTAQLNTPASVLAAANEILCQEVSSPMFVTCFYAALDLDSGRMHFANAGHNPPFHLQKNAPAKMFATGMPLGWLPNRSYDEQEAWLAHGDRMILYSDGLVEAHNGEKEMFGEQRMVEQLTLLPKGDPPIPHLLTHLNAFTGPNWEQEDDLTFVIVSRLI